ncbi:MAG: hypothetical protein H6574_09095 [Lewinellaceae bacterium]|nr:hypothetical protein [Lewinellaceae bacterium]
MAILLEVQIQMATIIAFLDAMLAKIILQVLVIVFLALGLVKIILRVLEIVFFGTDTGNKNTSGKFNSYFGYNAGKFDSVGIENCFLAIYLENQTQ